MDFTFFYTKKQLDGFLNSKFAATVLCPGMSISNNTEGRQRECINLPSQLESILEEIAATKKMIDPIIKEYIESIENESISQLLKYNNKIWSWREKSFLMRVSILALGGELSASLTKAACAIELLGMSFCLVDDLIDETSLYDLKQTTWSKYGYKEAICASEILSSLSHKALIDACYGAKITSDCFKEVMQVFQHIKCDAYISQFLDVGSEKTSEFSEENYFEMISKFPGTFYQGAIKIACLLSNVRDAQATKLQEFSQLLAIANQIRDDLIEIIGEEQVIGKKIGADISLNKKRLHLIVFLEHHSEYRHILSDASLANKALNEIIHNMKTSGVIDECIIHIKRLVSKAVDKIESLHQNRWANLLRHLSLAVQDFGDEDEILQ